MNQNEKFKNIKSYLMDWNNAHNRQDNESEMIVISEVL